jgi:ribosomal protein S18 acetylase RimI-like enzyme
MEIVEITEYAPEVVDALRNLLPQLSQSAAPPSAELTRQIIESESSHLLFATEGNTVLGMLTLVIFPIPSGIRAWVEDVVVDEAGRGRGVGEVLNRYAIEFARHKGARTIDLTSRSTREAANRLYQRIGFQPRVTNIYRLEIE